MKKIMFNDKYGLTQAVLEGRKTQTIRLVPQKVLDMVPSYQEEYYEAALESISVADAIYNLTHSEKRAKAPFYVGEEVAVAQAYEDCMRMVCLTDTCGWSNKMFVKAELMPHRIKITNIRVERLQDISVEDCLKEGLEYVNVNNGVGNMLSHWEYLLTYEDKLGRSLQLGSRDHKEAFDILIDKVSGKGTWEKNPYVFVYDFDLIK